MSTGLRGARRRARALLGTAGARAPSRCTRRGPGPGARPGFFPWGGREGWGRFGATLGVKAELGERSARRATACFNPTLAGVLCSGRSGKHPL